MDLKLELVTRLKAGERMAELCREFGIARKTGYLVLKRYEASGAAGLFAESRAPKSTPHKTPPAVVDLIIGARRRHPTWGPKKLKASLEAELGHSLPASSTIGDMLDRAGLVERRRRRRLYTPTPTRLRDVTAPNDTWCVDYKGQFRLGDDSLCYPLTVTDQFSRCILGCDGMAAISDADARDAFVTIFKANGLPSVMRSDNGVPFASVGLAGLTKLSVYWLRLGIVLERIRKGHPEDNGRHERMHRTLKRETTRPARTNLLQQQESFDAFVDEFNRERPHEAIDMRKPADVYRPSLRAHPASLPELRYPAHDDVLTVNTRGWIYPPGRGQIYLATALATQDVGIREGDDGRWLVTFATIDLGHVEPDRTFTPMPTGPAVPPEVLPMLPV